MASSFGLCVGGYIILLFPRASWGILCYCSETDAQCGKLKWSNPKSPPAAGRRGGCGTADTSARWWDPPFQRVNPHLLILPASSGRAGEAGAGDGVSAGLRLLLDAFVTVESISVGTAGKGTCRNLQSCLLLICAKLFWITFGCLRPKLLEFSGLISLSLGNLF